MSNYLASASNTLNKGIDSYSEDIAYPENTNEILSVKEWLIIKTTKKIYTSYPVQGKSTLNVKWEPIAIKQID